MRHPRQPLRKLSQVEPDRPTLPNVLASRYASRRAGRSSGRPAHKVVLERRLWIAVLRAQADLGVEVPDGVIEAYEAVVDEVDLASIDGAGAGHPPRREGPHRGVRRPRRPRARPQGHDQPRPHRERRAAPGPRLPRGGPRPDGRRPRPPRPAGHRARPTSCVVGRSHNVAAQATTLGKRFATCAEELLLALERVEELLGPLPAAGASRGRWARPRTSSTSSAATPPSWPPSRPPSPATSASTGVLDSVGQVYPRSLDLDVVAALVQAAAGPSSLATTAAADGRPRAGHRGVPGGPGRQLGHAPQDEQPQLRAGQRPRRRAPRPPGDGRASSPATQWNEGDVSLLGRAAGGAARRLPRLPTGCSRPSSPCSTSSAPTRR